MADIHNEPLDNYWNALADDRREVRLAIRRESANDGVLMSLLDLLDELDEFRRQTDESSPAKKCPE